VIDEQTLRAIRIFALQSAEEPTTEQTYAKICRWFSEKFSTPIMEVEGMDAEYVMRHFFEDRYQTLYEGDDKQHQKYQEERVLVLEPEKAEEEQSAKEDWIDDLLQEAEAQNTTDTANKNNILQEDPDLLNLIDAKYKLPDSGNIGE